MFSPECNLGCYMNLHLPVLKPLRPQINFYFTSIASTLYWLTLYGVRNGINSYLSLSTLDLSKVPTKVLSGPRFDWESPLGPKLLTLIKFQIYLGVLCCWFLCMGFNILVHIWFSLWDLRKPFGESILFCTSVRILFL